MIDAIYTHPLPSLRQSPARGQVVSPSEHRCTVDADETTVRVRDEYGAMVFRGVPEGVGPRTWRWIGALTSAQIQGALTILQGLRTDPVPTVAATATEVVRYLRVQDRAQLLADALARARNAALAEPLRSSAIRLAGDVIAQEIRD